MKIQSLKYLETEMRRVARGEIKPPRDAAKVSAESAEALLRLLTPQNRALMRIIRDEKPKSVAALAKLTNRAEPNLLRTLAKLESFGLVAFDQLARSKAPRVCVRMLSVVINPFELNDRVTTISARRSKAA